MLSAICFNLDLSKILLSGNALTSVMMLKNWVCLERVENSVEKGKESFPCRVIENLPNNQILDEFKLRSFADKQIKHYLKIDVCHRKGGKHCGKRS